MEKHTEFLDNLIQKRKVQRLRVGLNTLKELMMAGMPLKAAKEQVILRYGFDHVTGAQFNIEATVLINDRVNKGLSIWER